MHDGMPTDFKVIEVFVSVSTDLGLRGWQNKFKKKCHHTTHIVIVVGSSRVAQQQNYYYHHHQAFHSPVCFGGDEVLHTLLAYHFQDFSHKLKSKKL